MAALLKTTLAFLYVWSGLDLAVPFPSEQAEQKSSAEEQLFRLPSSEMVRTEQSCYLF